MIKCRTSRRSGNPGCRATERAAALIKQYDDGLIEKLQQSARKRERERERGRKLHKFAGRVNQSYHLPLPFTVYHGEYFAALLPKHLICLLTHTHARVEQATRANSSNRSSSSAAERARQAARINPNKTTCLNSAEPSRAAARCPLLASQPRQK